MSRDPRARISVEHGYLGKKVRALILLTLIDNVKKRRYLKIRTKTFDEIWQNSCQYRT